MTFPENIEKTAQVALLLLLIPVLFINLFVAPLFYCSRVHVKYLFENYNNIKKEFPSLLQIRNLSLFLRSRYYVYFWLFSYLSCPQAINTMFTPFLAKYPHIFNFCLIFLAFLITFLYHTKKDLAAAPANSRVLKNARSRLRFFASPTKKFPFYG